MNCKLASWSTDSDIGEKRNILKSALSEGASVELHVGYANKKQPDWHRKSDNTIILLLAERNKLYN